MKTAINKSKGFTIVELLIVVVVIAILAAIVLVSYRGIAESARDAAYKSDVKNVKQTVTLKRVTKDDAYLIDDPSIAQSSTEDAKWGKILEALSLSQFGARICPATARASAPSCAGYPVPGNGFSIGDSVMADRTRIFISTAEGTFGPTQFKLSSLEVYYFDKARNSWIYEIIGGTGTSSGSEVGKCTPFLHDVEYDENCKVSGMGPT